MKKRKRDVLDGMGSCAPNSSSGDAGYTSLTLFSAKFSLRIGCWSIHSFGNLTRQDTLVVDFGLMRFMIGRMVCLLRTLLIFMFMLWLQLYILGCNRLVTMQGFI